jgi:MFS family permease
VEKLAFAKAFACLRRRSLTVLVAAALLLGVIHSLYFLQTSKFLAARGLADNYLMPAMSIGQISEVVVMAFLGAMLGRFGFRPVLMLGAFSYVLRYLIFGTVGLPLSVLVASQFLHGLCFACVVVASYIYIDRAAPEDVRHSMQTVFMLVVSGVGSLIAGPFNGLLAQWCTPPGGVLDYSRFWYTAAGIGAVALVLLAALFQDETASAPAGER